ncbi:MAG TPA: UDP-N-acetylmuramoyl-L-alanine--D-glutamate ligase [Gemmatimonadaceae bacterium]|jgi:UDP-N-acetylmuramoylalanine--D-glutamate ligase|nr:UDP-N-acetylmuramoyl-L-alanine--D-glutamate ligase [Gemmatimonadaceae bacterium]
MIPDAWRQGEVAVTGLGRSGRSAAALLARRGLRVYVSDGTWSSALEQEAVTLRAAGVHVDLGAHDLDRIARAVVVVASPGVPPDAAPLARARAAGVPIVSEIEVGLHALPPGTRYIAITGTNGKTTTTAMVGHLLRTLGLNAVDAGNIGTPLTRVAMAEQPADWIALEMSSFQLHDTPGIRPTVGVLTNLAPDHLDRYASADEYYGDKALLFRNATAASRWVVNYGDTAVMAMIARVEGAHHYFGRSPYVDMNFVLPSGDPALAAAERGGTIEWKGQLVLHRDELALLGDHNVDNAMAAALAVLVADDAHQTPEALARIADGLRTFHALEHRLESAGEFGGVLWINDSKATNVSSTLVALKGMTRPTIVLLGGRHKGEPYTSLVPPLRRVGKAVLAYGEAGPLIAEDLANVVPVRLLGSDFQEVMATARSLAQPGDVVLLSPACSSYDMFRNYEERGRAFKQLARDGA